ncbi:MAG: hypothetical protein RJQ08_07175 [Salinisphaeraceae bacterium]
MSIPVCCIACEPKEERLIRGLLSAFGSRLTAEFAYVSPELAQLRIVDTRQPLGREIIELSGPDQLHHLVALVPGRHEDGEPEAPTGVICLKLPLSGNAFIEALNAYAASHEPAPPPEPADAGGRYYRGVAVPRSAPPSGDAEPGPRRRIVYRGQVIEK